MELVELRTEGKWESGKQKGRSPVQLQLVERRPIGTQEVQGGKHVGETPRHSRRDCSGLSCLFFPMLCLVFSSVLCLFLFAVFNVYRIC